MVMWKDPEPTSSHGHSESITIIHMEQFPLGGKKKPKSQLSNTYISGKQERSHIEQVAGITWKGICKLNWNLDFCDCSSRDTSISPGSGGQWDLYLWSTGLYIFAHFKSCSLRAWLPIRLNIGADRETSL